MTIDLQAWYPLRETTSLLETENRFGVPRAELFKTGVEYVASLRPDRLFTFGAANRLPDPSADGRVTMNAGVNLFSIPSTPDVMTLVDSAVVDITPNGATCTSVPGRAGFITGPSILAATDAVQVIVMSVDDDSATTDFNISISFADLAAVYPAMATHTPFATYDCCFDINDQLWVFVAVWDGGMAPPAILALRLGLSGAVEYDVVVDKASLGGDPSAPSGATSLAITGSSGSSSDSADPSTSVARGDEIWLPWYGAQTDPSNRVSTGLIKYGLTGGTTVEFTIDDSSLSAVETLAFYMSSRTGALVAHQWVDNGVIIPYVMFTDHWVTDTPDALSANPTAARYLRSRGAAPDTYGEWVAEITHLSPHDAFMFNLQSFNGGVPLTDPEAEALVWSLLGVSSWAEAAATYGPDYVSFDSVAALFFPDGSDLLETTGIKLWGAADYHTETEEHGSPRSLLAVDHPSSIRLLANHGMLLTTTSIGSITESVSVMSEWSDYFDGDFPAVALIALNLGKPPVVWINRIVI